MWIRGCGVGLVLALAAGAAEPPAAPPRAAIRQAIDSIRAVPPGGSRHNYIMNAAVRLAFFWISRDDVGQGMIREGRDGTGHEFVQLAIGSDPDKAPLALNRWGSATEVLDPASSESVFFGVLKPTNLSSYSAARHEAGGREPQFHVLLASSRPGSTVSISQLMALPREFTVKQAPAAQEAVLSYLESDGVPHVLAGSAGQCDRCPGFLFSMKELIADAVAGRPTPIRRFYRYNGKVLRATLVRNETVAERTLTIHYRDGSVSNMTYHNLRRAQFEVLDQRTGERNSFRLLLGTTGALAGVPVRIEFHPSWWLRLGLTLAPSVPAGWQQAARR